MTKEDRVSRASSVQWVRVSEIQISPFAQREYREHMAEKIAADFDPDKFGIPVVNKRDGRFWAVDGQHRIGALKVIGYEDQLIECQVYEGLDEKAEAEMFLGLNNRLTVSALSRYMVSLTAQRTRELGIARAVNACDLTIGANAKTQIQAVHALGRVYDLAGSNLLEISLRVLRDSYGDAGMRAELIEGMGLVAHKYNGQLDESTAVEKMSGLRGGMSGLMNKAEVIRKQVGRPRAHCVAAAVVETINSGRGGKKLPDWWSE